MPRILVVDDEPNVLSALSRVIRIGLAAKKPTLECFTDPWLAASRLAAQRFDIVLSDFRMPLMDGVQLLSIARRLQPEAARVILSASNEFEAVQRAVNDAGVFKYLCKPWDDAALCSALLDGMSASGNFSFERGG